MAVKSSGALSLTTDIVGEFGGVAPHSLSEYYGGGDYVPAGANPGIATSGAINFGSHYNAVAATVLNITSNVNNYDIGAQAIAAGGDKATPVILTINAGVTVGSTSSTTAAMYTGTGWSSGTTINITNNGSVVGSAGSNTNGYAAGGNGGVGGGHFGGAGAGGAGSSGTSGTPDSANNGGSAFEHSQTVDNNLSVIFDTAGTRTAGAAGTQSVTGGGGGGGGGGAGTTWTTVGGGGGGGGVSFGVGAGSTAGTFGDYGGTGATATATTPGAGGAGSWGAGGTGGTGGTGGSAGGAGIPGTNSAANGAGGAGGTGSSTLSGSVGSVLSGNTSQIS